MVVITKVSRKKGPAGQNLSGRARAIFTRAVNLRGFPPGIQTKPGVGKKTVLNVKTNVCTEHVVVDPNCAIYKFNFAILTIFRNTLYGVPYDAATYRLRYHKGVMLHDRGVALATKTSLRPLVTATAACVNSPPHSKAVPASGRKVAMGAAMPRTASAGVAVGS